MNCSASARRAAEPEPVAGLLVLDKPAGISSHGAVQRVRRALGVKRAGHAGTLDPLATGVLLVAAGRATRLLEYLVLQDKAYRATIRLGVSTDTLDREGCAVEERPVPDLDPERLSAVLTRLKGPQRQEAPLFSAIKRDGERLYRRVRRGELVAAPVRDVVIHELELVEWAAPDLTVDVVCSKGTYVRSLARDIGVELGTAGTLWQLQRTRSGEFDLAQAQTLDAVCSQPQAAVRALAPMAKMVSGLTRVTVSDQDAAVLTMGAAVPVPDSIGDGLCAVFTTGSELLAVGQVAGGELRPRKVLLMPGEGTGSSG